MSPPLPERIEPKRLAARGAVVAGTLALKRLPRLRAEVLDADGDISVRLAFHGDEEGRCLATGRVGAKLRVSCQRCLQAMELDIDDRVDICFLNTGNSQAALPSASEPVLMDGGVVSLAALIEDQLLLSLPFAPMHAPDCADCRVLARDGLVDVGGETEPRHPFAALAGLKARGEDEE